MSVVKLVHFFLLQNKDDMLFVESLAGTDKGIHRQLKRMYNTSLRTMELAKAELTSTFQTTELTNSSTATNAKFTMEQKSSYTK